MNKKKKFDCVEMKREIQAKIYEETKGMTLDQEREYRRKNIENGPFAQKWKAIQDQAKIKKTG